MKNVKRTILFIFLLLVILTVFSCADKDKKLNIFNGNTRIEYSKCVGCLECITNFNCPQNAILEDPRTHTAYIDADKCNNCMKCIDVFSCPENAFTTEEDVVPPDSIKDFSAVSDTFGTLNISFIAPGDDGTEGRAYRYELELRDANNQIVQTDFEVPFPLNAGFRENWTIGNLPSNETLKISLQAFDEVNHFNAPVSAEVIIAGEYHDEIPPAPITDLSAISSEENIVLSWTASGDDGTTGTAAAYDLRYGETEIDSNNWQQADKYEISFGPAPAGAQEELIINDLPIQTTYYFALKAIDEENNQSEISNVVSATIIGDIIPPAAITDLQVASATPNSILLNWTAVGDNETEGTAQSYIIKIAEEEINEQNWDNFPEIEQSLEPLPSGESETFLITDLEPETIYFAAVKAIDDAGNISPLSNIVTAETTEAPDEIPPAAISDLTATPTETEIILSWTAVGDDENEGTAFRYEIKKAEQEITEENWNDAELLLNPPNPLPAGTEQSYTVSGLEPEISYYFAIKAIDESENFSPLSNVVYGALLEDQTPPAAITDLQAEIYENIVNLSWTAPGDDGNDGTASYYEIRHAQEEITEETWNDAVLFPNIPEPNPAGSIQNFTVENLNFGIDYYFAIKAFDDNDNASSLSNVVYVMLENDIFPPAAITDLEVITGYTLNNSTIQIRWTAPGDDDNEGTATSYEIRYSENPITYLNWENATVFSNPPVPEEAGTTQTCNVTGLNDATIYYFAIKAFDEEENESAVSNSPGGKIVYQINESACHDCGQCINTCPEDAIYDAGPYKSIDADLCEACGECVSHCPWNLIHLSVVGY